MEAEYGEIKRMFVRADARGLKIGRRLLAALEAQARREGLTVLRLETGIYQPEAHALYRAVGFSESGPYGGYAPDPLSIFMEKRL
jgi:putative acetyltransferase